jgi:hypothetical protein
MKSLLFTGDTPFTPPPGCTPCRQETSFVLRKNGRLYTFTLRDKVGIEDPYLMLVKAEAFAIKQGEPYVGLTPDRGVRDALLKTNVVI